MYDIDFKQVKKGKKPYIIFLVMGLIFVIIPIILVYINNNKFKSMDSSVLSEEVINKCDYDSEGDYMCSHRYKYYVNGNEYICNPGVSTNGEQHNNKTVYYKKDKPSDCYVKTSTMNLIIIIFACLGTAFVGIGIWGNSKVSKRVKRLKELMSRGTLVKNLPYTMEPTGVVINGQTIMAPSVEYTLPNGVTQKLIGDGRYDYKTSDEDGTVDLLIDLNDTDNYFIDFEIKQKNM